MFLAPVTRETWGQYSQWAPNLHRPAAHTILAQDEGGTLLGGVSLYPCAPYMLVEHFAVNPEAETRLKLEALQFLTDAVKGVCTIENVVAITLVNLKGIAAVLPEFGFMEGDYRVFTCLPGTIKKPRAPLPEAPPVSAGEKVPKKRKKRKAAAKRKAR